MTKDKQKTSKLQLKVTNDKQKTRKTQEKNKQTTTESD